MNTKMSALCKLRNYLNMEDNGTDLTYRWIPIKKYRKKNEKNTQSNTTIIIVVDKMDAKISVWKFEKKWDVV